MRHRHFVGALFSFILGVVPRSAEADDSSLQSDLSSDPPIHLVAPDPAIQEEVTTLLQDGAYRFCQDEKYRLFQAEKDAVCHQLAAFEGRCQKLAAACERPAWEDDLKVETDGRWFDWSFLNFDTSGIAAFFKILFWASLAIGAFILLRALVRNAKNWKQDRDLEQSIASNQPEESAYETEEFRAQALFEMARTELAANRIAESLHLTYRALVRALADAEWVRPHRSKTAGDYLSYVRTSGQKRPSEVVQEVKSHLVALDRERYGLVPKADRARSLLDSATHIASRLTRVVAWVLSFSVLGCDFANVPEPPREPKAPRGRQLFEDLMRSRAGSVSRRIHRVTELPDETSTVVSLGAQLRKLEWETLERWARNGGHLVVAAPNEFFTEVFELEFELKPCSAAWVASNLSLARFGESTALVGESGGTPLAHCGSDVFAFSTNYDAGFVTVVADDALFDNVSLAAGDNATLALHLVGWLGQHVEYLGAWTGQGAFHPLQSIGRAGLGWWILHVLLLGAVYAWSHGKRFGTPVDPPEVKRRAFTEHAGALSLKYEKSRASGWALRNYAEWVYESLRRRAPSTKADLRSLTRAVSSNEQEATRLREAIMSARRADELGDSPEEHRATFLRLKSAIVGLSEVSRRPHRSKD